MKHLTIAVAGHVDHGKSALVRALTGIETDRLKEEQQRGMSIVMGFAHFATPSGIIDFIDVPGHQRFIKTMISGAAGVQALLLVVDAREQVKPQTIEHLELASLLGITRGFTVLTKSDLVPPAARADAVAAIRTFLSGTFLAGEAIAWASSVTGEGIEQVKAILDDLATTAPKPEAGARFYLPIDRAFSVPGAGAVVTGTLRYGAVEKGDRVEIVQYGVEAAVRRLESHNREISAAEPGWRTAINLRGVDADILQRGAAIASPGYLRATRQIDIEASMLVDAKPIRRGQEMMAHFGAGEFRARVFPIDRDIIEPGERAFAQLRFAVDVAAPFGERVILRTLSPPATSGGGPVVLPEPPRRRRSSPAQAVKLIEALQALAHGTPADSLSALLRYCGEAGLRADDFAREQRLRPEQAAGAANAAGAIRCAGVLFDPLAFETLVKRAIRTVRAYHAVHRLKPAMPRDELRRALMPDLPAAAYAAFLASPAFIGRLEIGGAFVREAGYRPEDHLTEIERRIASEIAEIYRVAALAPPSARDVVRSDRRKRSMFRYLVDMGILIIVAGLSEPLPDVRHRDSIREAIAVLSSAFADGVGYTVSELDNILKISRRHSIPLLEYLDRIGLTRRCGDVRFWNKTTQEELQ